MELLVCPYCRAAVADLDTPEGTLQSLRDHIHEVHPFSNSVLRQIYGDGYNVISLNKVYYVLVRLGVCTGQEALDVIRAMLDAGIVILDKNDL